MSMDFISRGAVTLAVSDADLVDRAEGRPILITVALKDLAPVMTRVAVSPDEAAIYGRMLIDAAEAAKEKKDEQSA